MKKQLQKELKQIAINILDSDSTTETATLKEHASLIYEKLCVLEYVENTPEITVEKIDPTPIEQEPVVNFESTITTEVFEEKIEVEEIENPQNVLQINHTPKVEETITENDLLSELEKLTSGFENLPEFEPAKPEPKTNDVISIQKTSLNDSLNKGINIGLNDRLAFVKQLFDNDMDDYTRVISQLNTLESSSGAKNFIQQMVKPEYNNWEGKEEIEKRFMNTVFRKFDA